MPQQEHWKSKIGFILAAAGSAIGLGAIWKFPYVAGTGGGGAFLLIFLLFTLLLGFPLLIGEFILGRKSQSDAITTYKKFAPNSGWHITGIIGVVTSFLVLSFYSVVGGWIILYLFKALTGGLVGTFARSVRATIWRNHFEPVLYPNRSINLYGADNCCCSPRRSKRN